MWIVQRLRNTVLWEGSSYKKKNWKLWTAAGYGGAHSQPQLLRKWRQEDQKFKASPSKVSETYVKYKRAEGTFQVRVLA
jgi:hypothetical protein